MDKIFLFILLCLPGYSSAQTFNQSALEGPDYKAWRFLNKHHITTDNLKQKAIDKLNAEGNPIYDYQRVEVTGVWSHDDTSDQFGDYFDAQIKPSNLNADDLEHNTWIHRAVDYVKDVLHADDDRNGQPSNDGSDAMASLKGKSINQLYCHSWGTDVVYNAILDGKIKPPHEIFVFGSPDHDPYGKWNELSLATGIKVHIINGEEDDVQQYIGPTHSDLEDGEKLQDLWANWIIKHNKNKDRWSYGEPRNEYGYYPYNSPTWIDLPTGHNRDDYYRLLLKSGKVPMQTATDMKAAQDQAINEKEQDILHWAERQVGEIVRNGRQRMQEQSPDDGGGSGGGCDLDPMPTDTDPFPSSDLTGCLPQPQQQVIPQPQVAVQAAPPPHVVAPVPMRPLPPTQEALNGYIAYFESYAQWDRNVAINVCKGQPLSDQDANSYVQNYILLSQYLTKYPSETGGYQFPKNMDDMRDGLSGCALEAMDDFISVADGYYNGHIV